MEETTPEVIKAATSLSQQIGAVSMAEARRVAHQKAENAPHSKDMREPCYGCGARCVPDGRGFAMNHRVDPPCEYLEALDYGGFREVRGGN